MAWLLPGGFEQRVLLGCLRASCLVCGTWLEDEGIPARVIDELMGHQRSRHGELEGGSRIGARYRHTPGVDSTTAQLFVDSPTGSGPATLTGLEATEPVVFWQTARASEAEKRFRWWA
jgi:hypothetical protein